MIVRLNVEKVTVKWESPTEPFVKLKREVKNPKEADQVFGVRFKAGQTVRLFVSISDQDVVNRTQAKITKIELVHIDASGIKAKPVLMQNLTPQTPIKAAFDIEMAQFLKDMNTSLNLNMIEARVTITGIDFQQTFFSSNLLHIALQQLILFIPGVAGSKIKVAAFPNENSFPAWSVSGIPFLDEFARLRCDRFGSPEPGAEAIKTELFDNFEPADFPKVVTNSRFDAKAAQAGINFILTQEIYTVTKQDAVINPFNHPVLKKDDGTRFQHFQMVPWPYDWRLRLEFSASQLIGKKLPETNPEPGEPPPNLGVVPPSIEKILADFKPKMELLADKVILTGHSTGGLIMRRALSDPKAKDLVSKAGFINVPFLGAPKAYFVFLTGKMLPIIDAKLLRHMSPHLPIVYYLAPTEQYPDKVGVITEFNVADSEFFRSKGQDVGKAFMDTFVKKMGDKYDVPAPIGGWKSFLERKARIFHASLTDPVIGFNNCRVYFSSHLDGGANVTPGQVRNLFTDPKSASFAKISGDGTVPKISLLGGLAESDDRVSLTSAGPAHDAAANDSTVWERLVRDAIVT